VVNLEEQTARLGQNKCALGLLLAGLKELVLTYRDVRAIAALKQEGGVQAMKLRLKAAVRQYEDDIEHYMDPGMWERGELTGFKLPLH
jgi:hypothetical protein